ncbi:MAG: cytochrome c oxidase subunit 4, partial [Planctomycetia bacterium]|nr:cytochrome c oxidase subunit 4 [Planctomycetia bacterium]
MSNRDHQPPQTSPHGEQPSGPDGAAPTIEMPRPTAWPMVLALGLLLFMAGMITNWGLSILGLAMAIVGLTGWIQQMLSDQGEMHVPLVAPEFRAKPVAVSEIAVAQLGPGMPGHRARLPEKIHPYSAGATGGLLGGVAMAATALTYGVISHRGIWYPINLLAGMVKPSVAIDPAQFSLAGLVIATLIHGLTSLGVGLVFGVLLPTLPRRPIFWGGIVGPLLWTGAIYSFMGVLNPSLKQAVDWPWFFASQFV